MVPWGIVGIVICALVVGAAVVGAAVVGAAVVTAAAVLDDDLSLSLPHAAATSDSAITNEVETNRVVLLRDFMNSPL